MQVIRGFGNSPDSGDSILGPAAHNATVSQTELQQQQRYPTSTSENTFPIKFTNQVPPAPLAHDAFYHQRVTLRKTWSRFSEHITLQLLWSFHQTKFRLWLDAPATSGWYFVQFPGITSSDLILTFIVAGNKENWESEQITGLLRLYQSLPKDTSFQQRSPTFFFFF